MTTPPIPGPMPELPQPGQKVRWRNPRKARAWGWTAAHGPGPFEVVCVVYKGGSTADLVLRTALGDQGINEVWLALAEDPENQESTRMDLHASLPAHPPPP